jgi:4-phospho-D-threonate 3-dehydrogenase / 4-phospho-D-erythronate 3-dehydrogenase
MEPVVALSVGDPAGIGPEVAVRAALSRAVRRRAIPLLVGYRAHLEAALSLLGEEARLRRFSGGIPGQGADEILLYSEPPGGGGTVRPGAASAATGAAAARAFEHAVQLTRAGTCCSLATAPFHKGALRSAGVCYPDHTGGLRLLTGVPTVRTMFQTGSLRIFFLTRHCSLRSAIERITESAVVNLAREAAADLARLGLQSPRLALAALNPHAGDGGLFGEEEIRILAPAVRRARREGLDLCGPVPADAVFHLAHSGRYDAVLSLFHDQGHIAAKTLDFHRTISLTFGLPFLRTSVDHGTALDLAGKGRADSTSMEEAVIAAAHWGPTWRKQESSFG